MKHTEECLANQERIAAEREYWLQEHPNHCTACHGRGAVQVDGILDVCPICIDNNLCPQCLHKLTYAHCENCGWKAGEGGYPLSWDERGSEDGCTCIFASDTESS